MVDQIIKLYKKSRTGMIISINGDSMFPLLKNGQKVYVSFFKKLQVSDIILFKAKEHFIVHRIVKYLPKQNVYITKGDNNYILDDMIIDTSQIVGVITVTKKYITLCKIATWISYVQGRLHVISLKNYNCTKSIIIRKINIILHKIYIYLLKKAERIDLDIPSR